MKIALGSAQFGMKYGVTNNSEEYSLADIKNILLTASNFNINTIDTAIAYGNSENILGHTNLDSFKIITKLPKIPHEINNIEKWVIHSIEESMKRLKKQYLDGVLLHHPGDLTDIYGHELFHTLVALKEKNLIRKIGISIYAPAELDDLKQFDFDIVQSPFSIFDRRLKNSGWLKRLNQQSVEVHTRSCFLQGLLLLNPNKIDKKFSKWKNLFIDLHNWVEENNYNILDVCLSYPMSHKEVDKVIVGIDNIKQLEQIIYSSKKSISYKYPNIFSKDAMLINPSNWTNL